MGLLSSIFGTTPPPPPEQPPVTEVGPIDDSPEARQFRDALIEKLANGHDPWREGRTISTRVLEAMRAVPRHVFVPNAPLQDAYTDAPLSIGLGQTISQPTIVAIMTDALELTGRERVLEIGTGCGYQTAVLSLLAREVYSIEILETLGMVAAERLRTLGCDNAATRIGSGYGGWPDHAPFDCIVLTAAPPALPAALPLQLADGGVLVAPLGSGDGQRLVRFRRHGVRLEETDLGGVRFVPMVPVAPEPRTGD